jgi:hypothetical protein
MDPRTLTKIYICRLHYDTNDSHFDLLFEVTSFRINMNQINCERGKRITLSIDRLQY